LKKVEIIQDKIEVISNIMELWEVLDDNGNATGEIMEKYNQGVFEKVFIILGQMYG